MADSASYQALEIANENGDVPSPLAETVPYQELPSSSDGVDRAPSMGPTTSAGPPMAKTRSGRELNDLSLLRGVPASNLFAWFGHLLSPPSVDSQFSGGSAETESWYASSRVVIDLSYFISHSWRDSKWMKYLALLWICNSGIAFVWGNVFALLWAIAEVAGAPCPTSTMVYPSGVKNVFGLSFVVYVLVFLLVLLFGHRTRLCRIEDTYFLDKCCIHQTDPVLKARGIKSLGGFLSKTQRLAVLYTRDYVSRLWCVYELACFGSIRNLNEVDFIAIQEPVLTCSFLLSFFLNLLGYYVSCLQYDVDGGLYGAVATVWGVLILFFSGTCTFGLMHLQRSRSEFQSGLQNFSFDDSKCYCCAIGHVLDDGTTIPCDREFVRQNVEEFFTSEFDCGSQGGVAKFEEYVRSDLSKHTRDLHGPPIVPLSWRSVFIVGATAIWYGVDIAILSPDVRIGVGNLFEFLLCPFGILLWGASMVLADRYGPQCSGWIAKVLDITITIIVSIIFISCWFAWDALVQDIHTPLIYVVMIFFAGASFSYLVYNQSLL